MKKRVKKVIAILIFTTVLWGCQGTNTDKEVETTIEPTVTDNESVGILHCSRKEFNPNHIDVSKLPNEVYDYSKSAALQDYTKDYVRLDYVMPNGLKIYTVGESLVGHVLLVYKDKVFNTDWDVASSEPLIGRLVSDFDGDGEDELAIAPKVDLRLGNLYVVELAPDKLWNFKELRFNDKTMQKYIWDNIHYSFDEEKHAEIFESKSGKNVITYSTIEGNYDPDVLKAFTPALDNYVNFLIADKTMDAFEYDYSCNAKEPNITEYMLQTGEMGVRVGIDFAMANSYGEAVFKIGYTENGFTFDDIEFINLKDTLRY